MWFSLWLYYMPNFFRLLSLVCFLNLHVSPTWACNCYTLGATVLRCLLLWFIGVIAREKHWLPPSLESLHGTFWYYESSSPERRLSSQILLGVQWALCPKCMMSKARGTFTLPLVGVQQSRAIAIAYNVWGVCWTNFTNNSKMGFLCLVSGLFIESLWLLESALSIHGNLFFFYQHLHVL